jgi:hypothetical protein
LDQFLRRLEAAEWAPAGHIDPVVRDLLAEIGRHPELVRSAIRSWNKSLDERQLRCHETATHYKWFIHYHGRLGYRVWLHQYKLARDRSVGHAEVPHNHRYSLASVILRGGFTHRFFTSGDSGVAELVQERRSYSAGDVYMVEWMQLHRLSELVDPTVTLVVESPVVRHYSEAFYEGSHEPRICLDFVALHSRLAADVGTEVSPQVSRRAS